MTDTAATPDVTNLELAAAAPMPASVVAVPHVSPRLGLLPYLSISTALGLLVVAVADSRARLGDPNASLVLWVGLLLIFVPNCARLLGTGASRAERVGCVLLVGLALYLVKIAASPLMFEYFDEFLHVRTAEDILFNSRLYTPNTLLPVSPLYPGMESATSALSLLGGLSVFQAGVILLAAGRLVFVLGLFLFYEATSGSARLAGVAALVYTANPSFVYFSGQFGYESLALPLTVVTLYLVLRRGQSVANRRWSWVLIVPMVAATVVTHHVSSFVLTGVLLGWTFIDAIGKRRVAGFASLAPALPTILMGALTITWLVVVASITVGYLAPAIDAAIAQVVRLALNESGARQLFRSTGPVPPLWETLVGFASVTIVVLALPIGLLRFIRTRPWNSLQLTLVLGALTYPATQAARFTAGGAEISARTTTFLFVAVGFVVALAVAFPSPLKALRIPALRVLGRSVAGGSVLTRLRDHGLARGVRRAAGTAARMRRVGLPIAALTILFMGSTVIAVPVWMRLPGPYLVGADPRSVEPQSIAAATWTLANLGRDNRFLTDRTNRLLLGAVGFQHPITAGGDRINLRPAFFAKKIGLLEVGDLRAARVRYVLVDRRLSTALPLVGVYTERGEANDGPRSTPMDPAALGKYDLIPGVSRLYDSGSIQIYDITALTNAGSQPTR